MENKEEAEKKVSKAKSYVGAPSFQLKIHEARKSFNANGAIKSTDVATVKLKKSKLVNGECITATSPPMSPLRRPYADMFMDGSSDSTCCTSNADSASIMSMNFSYYELLRNVSNPRCNSEGAHSSNTSNTCRTGSSDTNVKNEHLERYFRSAEMWTKRYRDVGPSRYLQQDK